MTPHLMKVGYLIYFLNSFLNPLSDSTRLLTSQYLKYNLTTYQISCRQDKQFESYARTYKLKFASLTRSIVPKNVDNTIKIIMLSQIWSICSISISITQYSANHSKINRLDPDSGPLDSLDIKNSNVNSNFIGMGVEKSKFSFAV